MAGSSAVPCVDFFFGIQKKGGKGQIKIELK